MRRRGATLEDIQATTATGPADAQDAENTVPLETDVPAARIARPPEPNGNRKKTGADVLGMVSAWKRWTGAPIRNEASLQQAGRRTFSAAGLSAGSWRNATEKCGASRAALTVGNVH